MKSNQHSVFLKFLFVSELHHLFYQKKRISNQAYQKLSTFSKLHLPFIIYSQHQLMYSSYYASTKSTGEFSTNHNQHYRATEAHKSTPQYLFLNMIRMFSIAFLILTIFYIPVYMGIGQIHLMYFKQMDTSYTYSQKILLQGTIFSLKNHETCYRKVEINQQSVNQTLALPQEATVNLNQTQVCYKNRLEFLPFISTVQGFHNFYFYYFFVLNLLFFVGTLSVEYINQKLYAELQYPNFTPENHQKLQSKKIFHLSSETKWPIYMLKPLLISKLQKLDYLSFDLKVKDVIQVKSIKVCIQQKFFKYAKLHLKLQQFQDDLITLKNKTKKDNNEDIQVETSIQQMNLKQKCNKINLQKAHLQRELQKILRTKSQYHQNHFWIQLQSFQDVINVRKQIKNLNSTKKTKIHTSLELKFDQVQFSDLIKNNIQNRQKIFCLSSLNNYESDHQIKDFVPNRNYKVLNKVSRILKVIIGVGFCLMLIALIDIIILIIQKNNIFSYATVLVVVVIEVILKFIIVKLSSFQRHFLHSTEKLSIMLKLTLFIFFNLVVMIFIGNHDLGEWKFGKQLSTYEFSSIDDKWFLKIGTYILIVVLIQVLFCNLIVYIEVFLNIFLIFISKRLSQLLKFNKIRQKIKMWIKDLKENYTKPIIDLEILYSQILPIYMIGLSFSYLFPILYPLLFVFSITIYHSHRNYIEFYTQKMQFSRPILNDWGFIMIYGAFIGGIYLVYLVENLSETFLFISIGVIVMIIAVFKVFVLDRNSMVLKRLQRLLKKEITLKTNQILNQAMTQRILFQQKSDSEVKSLKKLSKSGWISEELRSKRIQSVLLELFNSKCQNINQVHADYYVQYQEILQKQQKFIRNLLIKIQNLKNTTII